MEDGGPIKAAVGGDSDPLSKKAARLSVLWTWIKGRTGNLSIGAGVLVVALCGLLVANYSGPWKGYLATHAEWSWLVCGFAAPTLLLLLLALDPPDNFSKGPGILLPVLSLGLLTAITTLAALDATYLNRTVIGAGAVTSIASMSAFVAFFMTALIPSVWNAANFARLDAAERKRRQKGSVDVARPDDDDAEAMSALVATLIVCMVAAIAFVAGGMGRSLTFQNTYGLVLCGVVIGVFAVIVFLDFISELTIIQSLSQVLRATARKLHFLAAFYDWVDTGLVRIGAHVAGMGQEHAAARYLILAVMLSCLGVLAWYLPPPWGLLPAIVGLILAISVSRLWSWVEEDRALAAMTEYKRDAPYKIGFREDFRDEALLGFIFVFALVPIAMMQAHEGALFGPHLFEGADKRPFLDWVAFFGVELAKAVPIVDWAEIYEVTPARDMIAFKTPAAKHSVFLARVMVDLVLIAALLQAMSITSRNRQQKRLYNARHISRLDDFVERTELRRAIRATYRREFGPVLVDLQGELAARHFNLEKMGREGIIDFRRYDRDRLLHIYGATAGHLEQRGFIAAIAHEGAFALVHPIDLLRNIAEADQNEPAMYAAFERALEEHDRGVHRIDAEDIYLVLSSLRSAVGLRDFKSLLIDKFLLYFTADEVLDRLIGLGVGTRADAFRYTRNKIADAIADAADRSQNVPVIETALVEWARWENTDERANDRYYHRALRLLRAALSVQS